MKHVDVVIISWAKDPKLLQITLNGLDSIFGSEPGKDITFHIYVVESNLQINYDHYNRPYRRHSIQTIHPTSPFGYHTYLNIGIKAGNSQYVVLCNSDLTYENYWASKIIEVMDSYPGYLSASPWCPQSQGDNTPNIGKIFRGYNVREELAGWCIFQQRSIYEILGELDEKFTFWYCDNDYSMELQKHEIQHCLVADSIVNHHNSHVGSTCGSLTIEQQYEITHSQFEIFQRKWTN